MASKRLRKMIDLGHRHERYDLALPYGLSVTVKPLTTAGMAAAQAAARRSVEAVERQARERTEAGLLLDGLPDLAAQGERDGFYQAQLIRDLAVRHITSWTDGVRSQDRGQPALHQSRPTRNGRYMIGTSDRQNQRQAPEAGAQERGQVRPGILGLREHDGPGHRGLAGRRLG
jgi:hypothetical protein